MDYDRCVYIGCSVYKSYYIKKNHKLIGKGWILTNDNWGNYPLNQKLI